MREGSVLVLLAARERRRGAGSKPPARRAVVTRAGCRRVREPVDGVLAERAEDVRWTTTLYCPSFTTGFRGLFRMVAAAHRLRETPATRAAFRIFRSVSSSM